MRISKDGTERRVTVIPHHPQEAKPETVAPKLPANEPEEKPERVAEPQRKAA